MLKRLMNRYERATEDRLRAVCDRYGVEMYKKIRVADVLETNSADITSQHRQFALMAHFDFVIATAAEDKPLFAVEFDGPSHASAQQRRRDSLKDAICDACGLPILRVKSTHLDARFRGLDLLTWMVQVWFLQRDFDEWQDSHLIPYDEPFDPMMFVTLPGHKREFPLWLSLEPLSRMDAIHKLGKCLDSVPSVLIATEQDGTQRVLAWGRIDTDSGVLVKTAMRAQRFPIPLGELAHEIAAFYVWHAIEGVLRGTEEPVTNPDIDREIARFQGRHPVVFGSCYRAGPGK